MKIKTTNGCRLYWGEIGLTYSVLNDDTIDKLMRLIKIELKSHSKIYPNFKMRVSKKIVKDVVDGLSCYYLTVNGPYFKNREAISFNRDGFIGFAGWASSKNRKPFIDAFFKWCDYLILDEHKNSKTIFESK